MPRHIERRPSFTLRLSRPARERVEERALAAGIVKGNGEPNIGETLRQMLEYADRHMPETWLKASP